MGTSLVQLLINLFAIVTAATVTLGIQVRLARRATRRERDDSSG